MPIASPAFSYHTLSRSAVLWCAPPVFFAPPRLWHGCVLCSLRLCVTALCLIILPLFAVTLLYLFLSIHLSLRLDFPLLSPCLRSPNNLAHHNVPEPRSMMLLPIPRDFLMANLVKLIWDALTPVVDLIYHQSGTDSDVSYNYLYGYFGVTTEVRPSRGLAHSRGGAGKGSRFCIARVWTCCWEGYLLLIGGSIVLGCGHHSACICLRGM